MSSLIRTTADPRVERGELIDRRHALERLGAVALVAAAGCGGLQRRDLPAADTGEPPAATAGRSLDPAVRRLLGYAALASSAHNSQPWRVRVTAPDRLVLLRDPARRLPAVDPNDRELTLSLGAFLENLVQGGAALGYRCEVEPLPSEGDEMAAVSLTRAPAASNGDQVLAAITSRRILRSGYADTVVTPADATALMATALGARFFARGSREASLLRDGTIEANRLQAARDDAQQELATWIRWRDDDVRAKRDGLTAESMEIGGVAGWWVRHRYTAASVMTPGFRERGIKTAERQASAGGGWIVITSPDNSRPSLLDAGRRYERLLLTLRARGIAAHPMTQMLEERETRGGLEASLGVGPTIQFLLRVGYVTRYPEPVSVRRPVDWFLV